jgi:hypothetical protein
MGIELHPKFLSLTGTRCYQPLCESIVAKCCQGRTFWFPIRSPSRKHQSLGSSGYGLFPHQLAKNEPEWADVTRVPPCGTLWPQGNPVKDASVNGLFSASGKMP